MRIIIEDGDTQIIGQFSFDYEKDGSAFDYVRACADQVARQYFLTPIGTKLILASDKG